MRLTFQAADVHKPLLSISKVSGAGNGCHLNDRVVDSLDTYTGEKVPIMRMGQLGRDEGWVKEDWSATSTRPE